MKLINYTGEVTFCPNQVPSGACDGVNVTFLLPQIPIVGSLCLFQDGMLLKTAIDYSVSGRTVTMEFAPGTTSYLQAIYVIPN